MAVSTADTLEHEGIKVIGESRKSHIGFLLACLQEADSG